MADQRLFLAGLGSRLFWQKRELSFSHLEEQPLPRHRANKQLRCQKPWQWGTAPQLRGFFWKSDCVASVLSPVCLSFAVR